MANGNGGSRAMVPANGNGGVPAKKEQEQLTLQTLGQFIEARKDKIAAVVGKHMNPDRLAKIAVAACMKNPDILKCSAQSIYLAVHQAAQLGLEAGSPLGGAYLVPYKNQCQMQIGYKGYVDLAARGGKVFGIDARVVYSGDTDGKGGKPTVVLGTEPAIEHVPCLDPNERGELEWVYAVATLPNGHKKFDYMLKSEVEEIRKAAPGGNSPAWRDHYDEMAKKTVVRRLCKLLPMSVYPPEMKQAVEIENDQESGFDGLELNTNPEEAAPSKSRTDKLSEKVRAVAPQQPEAPEPSPEELAQWAEEEARASRG